jgi:hypothetical protein
MNCLCSIVVLIHISSCLHVIMLLCCFELLLIILSYAILNVSLMSDILCTHAGINILMSIFQPHNTLNVIKSLS